VGVAVFDVYASLFTIIYMDVIVVEGSALIRILILPQVTINVTKKRHKSTLFLPVYG